MTPQICGHYGPCETGGDGTDAIDGAPLWEALEAQQDVAGLLKAVGALDADDLALIVLERALAAIIARTHPASPGS